MGKVLKVVKIHFSMPEEYSEADLNSDLEDLFSQAGGEAIEIESHLDDELYKEEFDKL